jgi:hypothetical protein
MLPTAGILTDMHQINGVATLRVEVEGFLDSETPLATADRIGRSVASILTSRIPEMQSFTWSARAS